MKNTQTNAKAIQVIRHQILDLGIDPDTVPDQATLAKWRVLEQKLKQYNQEDHLAYLELVGSKNGEYDT